MMEVSTSAYYAWCLASETDGDTQEDQVLADKVIWLDPVALLTNCCRLLRTGGTLVMLTPNADSPGHRRFGGDWRGLEPPWHLHLIIRRTLTQLPVSITGKLGTVI